MTKSEIRINDQMTIGQMTKRKPSQSKLLFGHSSFEHSSFVRISDFGFRISAAAACTALPLLLFAGGCGSPSAANILLRKQNQSLQEQITQLNRQHAADVATIQSYERHEPTVPSLPETRLEQLFTVHGLQLGRLTGSWNRDTDPPGAPADGVEVEVVPTDDQGDPIKAAGAFTVQAFDLAAGQHPLVGTWHFPLEQARKLFYAHLMLYTYVLDCPWQHGPPAHADLTLRIMFNDALTGREFVTQKPVHVQLSHE